MHACACDCVSVRTCEQATVVMHVHVFPPLSPPASPHTPTPAPTAHLQPVPLPPLAHSPSRVLVV